jgi:hypothetical protein
LAGKGSPPGVRLGGRQKGSQNKKTIARRLALMEAGASFEEAMKRPLQFLLAVVADESQPIGTRIAAATSALPYTNHRLGLIDTNGISQPLVVQILRFSTEASEPAVVIEHNSNS